MAKYQENDSLQQLKAALKAGQPENLYVFHGEEMFLLHHYLQQLKNVVLEQTFKNGWLRYTTLIHLIDQVIWNNVTDVE